LDGAAVPEGPVEGNSCLHLDVTALGAGYWELNLSQEPFIFKAGKQYRLSAWLKCDQGTRNIGFVAINKNDGSSYGEEVLTMTDTWTEYSTTTKVFTEDVSGIQTVFQIGFEVGDFWIDDIQLIGEDGPIAEIVEFIDQNLKQAVIDELAEMGINTTNPTTTEMELLTFLAVDWGVPIIDFTGLEYAVNIEMLGLCGIQLETIPSGIFSAMPNLWHINVSWNNLTDITPLVEIQSLGSLKMHDNNISDISVLADLTNLWELELQNNNISDISPLTSLMHLEQLNLLANPLNADACTTHIPQIIANNPGITIQENACIEPGGNLLANGGFEDGGVAPWNLRGPDGAEPTGEVVQILDGAAVPEGPAEGNSCLHVEVTALGAGYWELNLSQEHFIFKAGKQYTLSAWLKCDQGTRKIGFVAINTNDWSGYGEEVLTMTDTWARYSTTTHVFTEDVSRIKIAFQIGFKVGDFWIDDIQLIED